MAATDWTATRSQPIAGLEIQTLKICGRTYARIVHLESGFPVIRWEEAPIRAIRDVVPQIVEHLSAIDWTASGEALRDRAIECRTALSKISAYREPPRFCA